MTELIDKLRRLAECEREVLRLRREVANKPLALRQDQQKVEQQEQGLAKAKAELKAHEAESRRLEKELKAVEEERLRTVGLQNQAKSNEEFQVHGRKIVSLAESISELETRILEGFDTRAELEQAIQAAQKRLAQAQSFAVESGKRLNEEQASLQAEFEGAEARRREVLQSLPAEDRSRYISAANLHKDSPMAALVDGVCQGCFAPLRPNDRTIAEAGRSSVNCYDCGRILRP